jgi:hypothetical protein
MIINIFNTELTAVRDDSGITVAVEVVTSRYSQEPTPAGDPVETTDEHGITSLVQPVEYLDEHIIESDAFTYSVPSEDQAEGKIASDYWADIESQSSYTRFIGND